MRNTVFVPLLLIIAVGVNQKLTEIEIKNKRIYIFEYLLNLKFINCDWIFNSNKNSHLLISNVSLSTFFLIQYFILFHLPINLFILLNSLKMSLQQLEIIYFFGRKKSFIVNKKRCFWLEIAWEKMGEKIGRKASKGMEGRWNGNG